MSLARPRGADVKCGKAGKIDSSCAPGPWVGPAKLLRFVRKTNRRELVGLITAREGAASLPDSTPVCALIVEISTCRPGAEEIREGPTRDMS